MYFIVHYALTPRRSATFNPMAEGFFLLVYILKNSAIHTRARARNHLFSLYVCL